MKHNDERLEAEAEKAFRLYSEIGSQRLVANKMKCSVGKVNKLLKEFKAFKQLDSLDNFSKESVVDLNVGNVDENFSCPSSNLIGTLFKIDFVVKTQTEFCERLQFFPEFSWHRDLPAAYSAVQDDGFSIDRAGYSARYVLVVEKIQKNGGLEVVHTVDLTGVLPTGAVLEWKDSFEGDPF